MLIENIKFKQTFLFFRNKKFDILVILNFFFFCFAYSPFNLNSKLNYCYFSLTLINVSYFFSQLQFFLKQRFSILRLLIVIVILIRIFSYIHTPQYLEISEFAFFLSIILASLASTGDGELRHQSQGVSVLILGYFILVFFFSIFKAYILKELKLSSFFLNQNYYSIYCFILAEYIIESRPNRKGNDNIIVFIVRLITTIVALVNNTVTVLFVLVISTINKRTQQKKIYISFVFICIGCILFSSKKENSFAGREFVFNRVFSYCFSNKKKLEGRGAGSFRAEYPLIQAKYFLNNEDKINECLADNITYALSEPMQILFEDGLLGITIYSILFAYLFLFLSKFEKNKPTVLQPFIVYVFFLSLTQYPFRVPEIFSVIILLFFPDLINQEKAFINVNLFPILQHRLEQIISWLYIFIGVGITILMVGALIAIQGNDTINNNHSFGESTFSNKLSHFLLSHNKQLLSSNVHESYYLMDYKKCLNYINKLERYEKSDYIYTLKGNIYLQLNDSVSAINCYALASFIVPKRINNHYALFRIFRGLNKPKLARLQTSLIIHSMNFSVADSRIKKEVVLYYLERQN